MHAREVRVSGVHLGRNMTTVSNLNAGGNAGHEYENTLYIHYKKGLILTEFSYTIKRARRTRVFSGIYTRANQVLGHIYAYTHPEFFLSIKGHVKRLQGCQKMSD